MKQEEKAKAYDEALELAKLYYGQGCNEFLDTIFPELRESEDEAIRKSIVATIEQCSDDFLNPKNRDRMLAYLEKQKENPKSADSISADCTANAKCGNSWHKVGDSLPESKRLANEVIKYLTGCGYSPVLHDDSNKKHFHIDIPRHKDDFWRSEEYKHCRSVLGEYYMEGDYGGDTYTLYIWRAMRQLVDIAKG